MFSIFRAISGTFICVMLGMATFFVSSGIITSYHFNDMFGGLILGAGIFWLIVALTLFLEKKWVPLTTSSKWNYVWNESSNSLFSCFERLKPRTTLSRSCAHVQTLKQLVGCLRFCHNNGISFVKYKTCCANICKLSRFNTSACAVYTVFYSYVIEELMQNIL